MQKAEEEQEVKPDYKTSKPTFNGLLPPARLWKDLPYQDNCQQGNIWVYGEQFSFQPSLDLSGGNSNWKIRPSRPSHKRWDSALNLPFSSHPRCTNTPTILCCFSPCWNSWRINSCPIWAHLFIVINFWALQAEKQHQLYSETRWLYFCLS